MGGWQTTGFVSSLQPLIFLLLLSQPVPPTLDETELYVA